jgi:hypothetical protein
LPLAAGRGIEFQYGLALTVQARPVALQVALGFNAGSNTATFSIASLPSPAFELLVSVSALATNADAIVGMAGAARFEAALHVELDGDDVAMLGVDTSADLTARWQAVVEGAPEGNYKLRLTVPPSTAPLAASVGVR